MADPIAVVANEYYAARFIPETSSDPHPHPPLRLFKIIMVSEILAETSRIVLKWPSMESLAFFFLYPNETLPAFDYECTLPEDEATRLIKDRVDELDLCFIYAKLGTPSFWLHDQGLSILDAVMTMEEDDVRREMRSRIKDDQFYAIDYSAAPERIKRDCLGFQRVAWVSRHYVLPPYSEPMVEVRIPSLDSLTEFMATPDSSMLPKFNRVFGVNISCAQLFLQRIVPLELCYQMRMRRDFWINAFEIDCFMFVLTADDGTDGGALTGGDAHVDDACDRAHVSGADDDATGGDFMNIG